MASGDVLSIALLTEKKRISGCQRGPSSVQGSAELPRMVICSYDMLHRLTCEACKGSAAACTGAMVCGSLHHLAYLPVFLFHSHFYLIREPHDTRVFISDLRHT